MGPNCYKRFIIKYYILQRRSINQRCIHNLSRTLKICQNFGISEINLYNHAQDASGLFKLSAPFSISCVLSKFGHTTKNWKFIARDGEKPEKKNEYEPSEVCEDGQEAVHHGTLMEELRKCSTVSEQIETLCSLLSITQEEVERKKAFCRSFDKVFSLYFQRFELNVFGSSVNGLGFRGCDTDVCFQTNFDDQEPLRLKEVPTLESVLNGTVSRETISRMNPYYTLRFVRRILRDFYGPNVSILLIKSRTPILRFYSKEYDVFCDFSCESNASIRNTKLFLLCCALDSRFAPLAQWVRYWGKWGRFVGDIDRFNSYSFALLVLHFLQTIQPPVLPPVEYIILKSEYLLKGKVDDSDLLRKDIQHFSPSQNKLTTEQLLRGFFFHYLSYDFNRVLSPFHGTSTHKADFVPQQHPEEKFMKGSITLEDPFRRHFNATGGVDYRCGRRFCSSLLDVCHAYQESHLWTPNRDLWGLCTLFRTPQPPPTIETIHIPHIPDAPLKLRKLLEQGLLFKCHETTDGHLLCRVYNTLVGREAASLMSDMLLEQEQKVSKWLLDQATSREPLCDLKCEWVDECVLRLSSTRPQPTVMVLLKELIPRLLPKVKSF